MKHNKYINLLEYQHTAKLQLFLPIYPIKPNSFVLLYK